jgi:hypothetical protein
MRALPTQTPGRDPARMFAISPRSTLGSALAVMNKAGADFPTWTIVGMPALVGLLTFVMLRASRDCIAA